MNKKHLVIVAILLGVTFVLSACGSGDNAVKTEPQTAAAITTEVPTTAVPTTAAPTTQAPTEEPTTEAPIETTTSEPESTQVILHLNEKTLWGDFELTIIDVRLFDKDGFSVNYSTGGRKYGGPSVAVTYSLKNIGKTAGAPSGNILQLNYADGYKFNSNVNVNGKNPNIYAHGGINTPTTLAVLSSEHYYLEAFTVPEQVINDTDGALFITLAYADSVEKSLFRYDIRPIDDIQTEALYQHAIDLMNDGRHAAAFFELAEMTDYKDVSELRTKCAVNCYGNKYNDYLMERINEFETLADSSLSEILPGTWNNINNGEIWKFSEDGTMDPGRKAPADGSKVTGKWQVNGEILQITLFGASGHSTVFEYKVKQVGDYGLIFISEKDGKISISGKLAK